MALTGMQMREQIISFALQNADAQDREITELQKQIAVLQKQIADAQPDVQPDAQPLVAGTPA